jgi:decaprenylphospho-beta-D-ribofuranose 2-oxidase
VVSTLGDDAVPHRDVLLSGWGRSTWSRAEVVTPRTEQEIFAVLGSGGRRGVIARGLGRSYGDVAQNAGGRVIDMTGLSAIRELDAEAGLVTVEAGVSLDALLRAVLPLGWFVPVTPGTRFVTVGGSIANDIHGKNHHRDGGFCDHVVSIVLVAPGVGRIAVQAGSETFRATAGGLGLTGVITAATLRLIPVETSRMRVDLERATDVEDLMGRMEAEDHRYRYSVAWIDCTATGSRLGRGVLTRGDHAAIDDLPAKKRHDQIAFRPRDPVSVPRGTPALLRGPALARALSEGWFRKDPWLARDRLVSLREFFYPLDAIGDWNRLYGRRGFVQYQVVVPFGEERTLVWLLEQLQGSRCPAFLGVLKRFGAGGGMLSFPRPGGTLAIDIPAAWEPLAPVLDRFDAAVVEAGGRVYLAKDGRLRPEYASRMYPELDEWRGVRERLDPDRVLRSDLERRLGVATPVRSKVAVA